MARSTGIKTETSAMQTLRVIAPYAFLALAAALSLAVAATAEALPFAALLR